MCGVGYARMTYLARAEDRRVEDKRGVADGGAAQRGVRHVEAAADALPQHCTNACTINRPLITMHD